MTNYDVVKKLLGPIDPIGESNADEKRFNNLETTIELVYKLICDIRGVAANIDRHEWSIKKAGEAADQFLKEIEVILEDRRD